SPCAPHDAAPRDRRRDCATRPRPPRRQPTSPRSGDRASCPLPPLCTESVAPDKHNANARAISVTETSVGWEGAPGPAHNGPQERKCAMRRTVLLIGLVSMCLVGASAASAATTTSVTMSFTEQIVPNIKQDCSVIFDNGFCGNGVVLPLRSRD